MLSLLIIKSSYWLDQGWHFFVVPQTLRPRTWWVIVHLWCCLTCIICSVTHYISLCNLLFEPVRLTFIFTLLSFLSLSSYFKLQELPLLPSVSFPFIHIFLWCWRTVPFSLLTYRPTVTLVKSLFSGSDIECIFLGGSNWHGQSWVIFLLCFF